MGLMVFRIKKCLPETGRHIETDCLGLSLRELGSTACGFEAVLLSFLHTGVTGEESCLLEGGTVGCVCLKQSLCNAVTDGACLSGESSAVYAADDVELTESVGNGEGLVNDELESFETEILVNILTVDVDNAGSGNDADTSNGLFSSSCSVEIRLRACIHGFLHPFLDQSLQATGF